MKNIMKSLAILSVIAISLVMFSQAAMAIQAVATAKVVTALTVDQSRALNFGSFIPGAGGNVILTAEETTARTAGVNITLIGTAADSGKFGVTYSGPAITPTISITDDYSTHGDSQVTLSSGGNIMVANLTNSGPLGSITGNAQFYVGGTLTVVDGQAPGQYTGTYTITVTYY